MSDWMRRSIRALGDRSARHSLSRGLDGVRIGGFKSARRVLSESAVVFAATHVSWWDGLVVGELGRQLGADQRILVDAARMRAFPFFLEFDCIPVELGTVGARHGLRRAVEHLSAPGRAVWLFPQGRQVPPSVRPLELQRGAAWLAKQAGVPLVPVALDYRFLEAQVPAAWVDFGTPVAEPTTEVLRLGLEEGLTRIDRRSSVQLPAAPPDTASRALSWVWRAAAAPPGGAHG